MRTSSRQPLMTQPSFRPRTSLHCRDVTTIVHLIVTREHRGRLHAVLLLWTTQVYTAGKAVPIPQAFAAVRVRPVDAQNGRLPLRDAAGFNLAEATPVAPHPLVMREPHSARHQIGSNYAVEVYKFRRCAACLWHHEARQVGAEAPHKCWEDGVQLGVSGDVTSS